MNNQFKKDIKKVFTAPPSQRKDEFISQLHYPKSTLFEVFISQIGYIKKSYWVISILILAIMGTVIRVSTIPTGILTAFSVLTPFLTLLCSSEIHKSVSHNMAELELSCKHSFSQITLMRLTIVGTISAFTLLVIIIMSRDIGFGLIRNGLYLTVPFLLSSYLSLWIMNHFKIRETLYICCGVTVFVSVSHFILSSTIIKYYDFSTANLWLFALILIGGLLALEILKFIKKSEELSWNLALTD